MKEWLEADGMGGFALGTSDLIRRRRYHALLVCATRPPTGRVVLVSGLEVYADTPAGSFALTSQHYFPDVIHPDGVERLVSFDPDPWPRWRWRLPSGLEIEHELFVPKGSAMVALSWRALGKSESITLRVRPLIAARDYHALQRENASFRAGIVVRDGALVFAPYQGMPEVLVSTSGEYHHDPIWFQRFLYAEERARGLDHLEDLASPGEIRFDLTKDRGVLLFAAQHKNLPPAPFDAPARAVLTRLEDGERKRRAALPSKLERAADAYFVEGLRGRTIVAGYPWFTDWGRDTFIALRGLCLATKRLEDAQEILSAWGNFASDGLLPNRFPDVGGEPEYNSIDAALWYVIAVRDYLDAASRGARPLSPAEREAFEDVVRDVLDGLFAGSRHGIRVDDDGLLAAGDPGVALTWMDAKLGDWVVTPRIGKPVEIEALWLNALAFASKLDLLYQRTFEKGLAALRSRFWDPARGVLFDVVDVEHRPGAVDARMRPNQIFAAGGLPLTLLDAAQAKSVVDTIESELYTPLGLRTLGPNEPGYTPHYQGDIRSRDAAYHQGTAWPWLLGPFVEAWVKVHGATPEVRAQARRRFVAPILAHLEQAGLGHVSELTDGDPPHAPGGCPFQAWSVGELLRIDRVILAER